jgi:N-acetylglucosaminyl-diphospho-decaprenol L-rhamnosyltransferase
LKLYICIVSHGHAGLILESLHRFLGVDSIIVCVVDNLGEISLREYCEEHSVFYVPPLDVPCGFGANNNRGFRFLAERVSISNDDYFVCCNPDVSISREMLLLLHEELALCNPSLASINLFRNSEMSELDPNIRFFPRISDYVGRLLRVGRGSLVQREIYTTPVYCDWAAGSFLILKPALYATLHGFDERYFMYFEDVDLCLRARRTESVRLLYLPKIKAIHIGAFQNRRLFSKHFSWYFRSLLRYLFRFYFIGTVPKRRIEEFQ